ncbi:flagellar basal body-associated protein FliL [Moritella sp. F3]|uniref:flagellar basal body-associated protein FliL n=1 Tax=Moritella sp. F3 TaxID=2718882 RepID=UPI0018E198E7|nr:flagellar basal body-associated protein FliL [Moritella sp. F3]GIC78048.1 flagellar basal body-associated protein FliL [Moritella sp. F1]GIC82551.1 flagellar basal body-associated protein FliL [Moritella sp. F3]
MADDKDLKIEEKGKGNKKIIIIAVILVLALAGGAAAFFLLSDDSAVADSAEVATETVDKSANQTAYYVAMPRPFVFNIIGLKRERLVQIKVQLMVRGSDNQELAKANIPLIESTLLQVFSATTEQQLATYEGKELLRSDSLTNVNDILTKYTGVAAIEKILFSGFVMQ